jgi:hypothetical protein
MKRYFSFLLTVALILVLSFSLNSLSAQEPPHPPTIGHGTKGNQPTGSAPIDGGLSILLAMGLAYGAKKSIKTFKA